MDEELRAVAEAGDVEGLYGLIRRNPYILEGFEGIPFAETPLHMAAYFGHTHLAVEIFGLKPSFARKLNHAGLSPLHLTLVYEHTDSGLRERRAETAIRLVNIDPDLVRVQGKNRMTPLHFAAATDDDNLVAEFLCACPDSIQDFTINGDTALHVAARNRSLIALPVLSGWFPKTHSRGVLNWKNENGQTAEDVAQSLNLPQDVVEVLGNGVKRDGKDGLSLPRFMCDKSMLPSRLESLLVPDLRNKLGGGTRKVLLMAAALIATATYQAALSPPGGLRQIEGGGGNNQHAASPAASATYPRAALRRSAFESILFWNSAAFALSLAVIHLNLQINAHTLPAQLSLFFLMLSYTESLITISPQDTASKACLNVSYVYFCLIFYIRLPVYGIRRRRCLGVPLPRYNPSRFLQMRDRLMGS